MLAVFGFQLDLASWLGSATIVIFEQCLEKVASNRLSARPFPTPGDESPAPLP